MCVPKTGGEHFANRDNPIVAVVILHGLPRLVVELQSDASSALGLDDPRRDFLQMLFYTLIITERKLYKGIRLEAFRDLRDEVFDWV